MLQVQNTRKPYTKGLVAVGANLPSLRGGVRETIIFALELLICESVRITAQSRFFRTSAFPEGSGPDFTNAVVAVETTLTAPQLLAHLHDVEARTGRTRTERWEARVLDLDLLDLGGQVLPDLETYTHWLKLPEDAQQNAAPDQAILPHPRMQDRGFVLVPLLDIAPDWRHPILGKTARQMVDALPSSALDGIAPLQ